jgi:small subunit ribosomal protein S4
VDIPSFGLKPGDVVKVRDRSKNLDIIHSALKDADRSADIPWLRLNKAALEGELLEVPKRADIPVIASEQLIVELYSK